MSEDPTQDIGEKYDTRPILKDLLAEMRAGFERVERRLEGFDVRLDRIESEVKQTHSELLSLRADFKELRAAIKEHFPSVVK